MPDGNTFWAWATFLVPIGVLLAVVIAVVRARRRNRAASGSASGTGWAAAALVLARSYLVLITAAYLYLLVSAGASTSTIGADGLVARDGSGALTVKTTTTDSNALCAPTTVQNVDGPYRYQGSCRASRAIERADPPSGKVTGYKIDVTVQDPSPSERRTFAAIHLAGVAGLLLGVFALERILRQAARRQPFAAANIHWLRLIAAVIAVDGWLLDLLAGRFGDALVARAMAAELNFDRLDSVGAAFPSTTPIAVAVLILVLAEIWRFGIRLQRDAEATV